MVDIRGCDFTGVQCHHSIIWTLGRPSQHGRGAGHISRGRGTFHHPLSPGVCSRSSILGSHVGVLWSQMDLLLCILRLHHLQLSLRFCPQRYRSLSGQIHLGIFRELHHLQRSRCSCRSVESHRSCQCYDGVRYGSLLWPGVGSRHLGISGARENLEVSHAGGSEGLSELIVI